MISHKYKEGKHFNLVWNVLDDGSNIVFYENHNSNEVYEDDILVENANDKEAEETWNMAVKNLEDEL